MASVNRNQNTLISLYTRGLLQKENSSFKMLQTNATGLTCYQTLMSALSKLLNQ